MSSQSMLRRSKRRGVVKQNAVASNVSFLESQSQQITCDQAKTDIRNEVVKGLGSNCATKANQQVAIKDINRYFNAKALTKNDSIFLLTKKSSGVKSRSRNKATTSAAAAAAPSSAVALISRSRSKSRRTRSKSRGPKKSTTTGTRKRRKSRGRSRSRSKRRRSRSISAGYNDAANFYAAPAPRRSRPMRINGRIPLEAAPADDWQQPPRYNAREMMRGRIPQMIDM